MGRRKIVIKRISDDGQRKVTFEKRKIGLVKKAMELSILCDAEISMTIHRRDEDEDLSIYSSSNFDDNIKQYRKYNGTYKLLTNEQVTDLGKTNGRDVGILMSKRPSNGRPTSPALSNLQTQLKSRRHRAIPHQMLLRPATMTRSNVVPQFYGQAPEKYQHAFDELYLSLVGHPSSGASQERTHNINVATVTAAVHDKSDENDAISSNQSAPKKLEAQMLKSVSMFDPPSLP